MPEITPDEIRAKLQPKRSQAAATYNRYLAVLSSIMDFATRQQEDDTVFEQYIEEDPSKKVHSQPLNNKIVRFDWCDGSGLVRWERNGYSVPAE